MLATCGTSFAVLRGCYDRCYFKQNFIAFQSKLSAVELIENKDKIIFYRAACNADAV